MTSHLLYALYAQSAPTSPQFGLWQLSCPTLLGHRLHLYSVCHIGSLICCDHVRDKITSLPRSIPQPSFSSVNGLFTHNKPSKTRAGNFQAHIDCGISRRCKVNGDECCAQGLCPPLGLFRQPYNMHSSTVGALEQPSQPYGCSTSKACTYRAHRHRPLCRACGHRHICPCEHQILCKPLVGTQ